MNDKEILDHAAHRNAEANGYMWLPKEPGGPAVLVVPMLLVCPQCKKRHVDQGDFATKVHHTHACQFCGHVWRPAIVATLGVRFLPGFKNDV